RTGNLAEKGKGAVTNGDVQKNMSPQMIFDYMSIVLNKEALSDEDFVMNVTLIDTKEAYNVHFKAGVMLVYEGYLADNAQISITGPKNGLLLILQRNKEGIEKYFKIDGEKKYLDLIIDNITSFDIGKNSKFNIVEP
ncbi:MAG: alkyl sulfatase C-terminal domain-containing protein, partial [Clostridia bacterium]|nr:alkyl sulfatase C-terminal domain-containing protein [Clostridia bacterium]